ncbi:zinc-dependent alcohol dehydrogenase family protein [Paenibacillus thermotolerans]|uniref:zinc-dependent alcohol dehydrogenase family protein n=1 Tax=Paenibacillus thermotolerans TaxID=3027807 RepID=UPI002368591A|nr:MULTISPECIES: zinc-dependent alcohol dehydrogenase family protein [unclassified Paenibacillus]
MRAAILKGKRAIELVTDRNAPELRPDEVRVRVKACGICGTDQHIYHGHPGSAEVEPPIVLGHELAGEVVEVGGAVTELQAGDRVSIDPNMYCGGCEYCRNGTPNLCDRLQAIGVTRDGGMGEYCSVPAVNCYLLPAEVSDVEGALVEPLGCVLHGFKKLDIRPIHTVMIVGGGFIGQLFLQLVKQAAPANITVSEPVDEKHERLLKLGADRVIRPGDSEAVREWVGKADVVIECVGRKDSMELSLQAAKKGGQVLLFGVASPETEISVSPFAIFSKELKVMGSFINPYTHEEVIALIRRKAVRVEELVSHRFSLEEIPEAMEKYPQLNVSKGVIVY